MASATSISDPLVPHRAWVYDENIKYSNYNVYCRSYFSALHFHTLYYPFKIWTMLEILAKKERTSLDT